MQRDQPRLGAEADERADRDERLNARPRMRERERIADRAVRGENEHRHPHADATDVRDREVGEDRIAHRTVAPDREDRRRRDECHQLPEAEKGRDVASGEHARERDQEHRGERPDDARRDARAQVGVREHERRNRRHREHDEEEAAESIDAQGGCDRAAKARADMRAAQQRHRARGAEQRDPDSLRRQPGCKPAPDRAQPATDQQPGEAGERDGLSDRQRSVRSGALGGPKSSSAKPSSSACPSARFDAMIALANSSSSSVRGSFTR
jgi:hypothetical protein